MLHQFGVSFDLYSMLFADDQLLIAQNYDELHYMTRKLIDEYEFWGLKLNVKRNKIYDHKRRTKRFATGKWEGGNKLCKRIYLLGE